MINLFTNVSRIWALLSLVILLVLPGHIYADASSYYNSLTCPIAQQKYPGVDLRSKFGRIRQQGSMGWCYAYAAADLLTFHLHEKKIIPKNEEVSAAHMALSYNRRGLGFLQFSQEERLAKIDKLNIEEGQISKAWIQLHEEMAKETRGNAKYKDLEEKYMVHRYKDYSLAHVYLQHLEQIETLKSKHSDLEKNSKYKEFLEAKEEIKQRDRSLWESYEAMVNEVRDRRKKVQTEREKLAVRESEGGNSDVSLNSVFDNGICFESNVKSSHFSYDINSKDFRVFGLLGESDLDIKKILDSINYFFKYGNDPSVRFPEVIKAAHFLFPNMSRENLEYHLRSKSDPLGQISDLACESEQKLRVNLGEIEKIDWRSSLNDQPTSLITKLKEKALNWWLPKNIKNSPHFYKLFYLKKIDEILDNGFPVVVSHHIQMFDKKDSGGHALLAVGRRLNCKNGNLEYILRNSWGPSTCMDNVVRYSANSVASMSSCMKKCEFPQDPNDPWILHDSRRRSIFSSYNKCESTCKIQAAPKSDAPFRCENGYYIVDAAHLLKHITEVTYISE